MDIAVSARSTSCDDNPLAGLKNIRNELAGLRIGHKGARRNIHDKVLATPPIALSPRPGNSVLGEKMRIVIERYE
jgi:hypothetical protein